MQWYIWKKWNIAFYIENILCVKVYLVLMDPFCTNYWAALQTAAVGGSEQQESMPLLGCLAGVFVLLLYLVDCEQNQYNQWHNNSENYNHYLHNLNTVGL
jgi:hypothetical protein